MSGIPSLALGRSIALATAASYGLITTLARVAYDGGTNPTTMALLRFVMAGTLMFLILLVLRKPLFVRLPFGLALATVVAWYLITMGHVGAVKFIPVSLGAMIFYTFPLMVIAYKRMVNRMRVRWSEATGFALAFAGICIALGPDFSSLSWTGIAMAFAGAGGAAALLLLYERFPADADVVTTATLLTFVAAVLAAIVSLVLVDFTPPQTRLGWMGMIGVAIATTLAFILNLFAVRFIGAAQTALLMNLEPVVIMIMAKIVLDEPLTIPRVSGMLLVVIALLLSQWRERTIQ